MISHKAKLIEIATILDKDPTSISKEIKRIDLNIDMKLEHLKIKQISV